MKENIDNYPPILSLINIALEYNKELYLVAGCRSDQKYKEIVGSGVVFKRTSIYQGNLLKRLYLLCKLKKIALNVIKKVYDKETLIWVVQSELVGLLGKSIKNYDTVGHFLEVRNPELSLGYKLLSIGSNYKQCVRNLNKVVCCEYNRAQITKWLFSLKEVPVVLPNKPYWDDNTIKDNDYTKEIAQKYLNKKIILYQGLIDRERNLESFIEAVNTLNNEYVFFIMGNSSPYSNELKKSYESDRIVFLNFITPPIHLCITRMSYIGILSYTPNIEEIGTVLNVLYCAPNKIFEYSKFGKPMISNENPALKMQFSEYKAGISVDTNNSNAIVNAIKEISSNYNSYSKHSLELYDSVDVKEIIKPLINDNY